MIFYWFFLEESESYKQSLTFTNFCKRWIFYENINYAQFCNIFLWPIFWPSRHSKHNGLSIKLSVYLVHKVCKIMHKRSILHIIPQCAGAVCTTFCSYEIEGTKLMKNWTNEQIIISCRTDEPVSFLFVGQNYH